MQVHVHVLEDDVLNLVPVVNGVVEIEDPYHVVAVGHLEETLEFPAEHVGHLLDSLDGHVLLIGCIPSLEHKPEAALPYLFHYLIVRYSTCHYSICPLHFDSLIRNAQMLAQNYIKHSYHFNIYTDYHSEPSASTYT